MNAIKAWAAGRCPICNKPFKSDACPHSYGQAEARVAQYALEQTVSKEVAKQLKRMRP